MDEKKTVFVYVFAIILAKILSPGKKNLFIPAEEYLKLYFYKIIFIFITELNAIKMLGLTLLLYTWLPTGLVMAEKYFTEEEFLVSMKVCEQQIESKRSEQQRIEEKSAAKRTEEK
jgi:hypothetical protein